MGLYTWQVVDRALILTAIDDTCAIHLQAANLAGRPWQSCRPPNVEAGITHHWPKPAGCEGE